MPVVSLGQQARGLRKPANCSLRFVLQHVSAEEKALQAKWVELAHDQALKSEAAGGIPIGSVLVHQPTRKVIAAGHNQRMQKNSNILHGEMDCFENAGRTYEGGPIPWRETVCITTLSPCLMCTGAILMYGIPAVIIAEHDNYLSPGEELLASKGVKVTVVNNHKCIQTMSSWIKEHPQIWHEDVAGNVNGARV